MNKNIKLFLAPILFMIVYACAENKEIGKTEITKWKYGKRGAVSFTYDDGNIHQFDRAMPILDRLGFSGTFFIVTGAISKSTYSSKFVGRSVEKIIRETATIKTNEKNFFERASAIGHVGYKGTLDFHFKAGQLFEGKKVQEAYKVIDDAYAKVRSGTLEKGKDTSWEAAQSSANTWADFNKYAARGHEFGSHTVSHARLAVLDEPNLLYELEKSKEDILTHMGPNHIFSAECPFGTENERVMEYALKLFPALRNRMPHSFLDELNRGSKNSPVASQKEYVQWQRGPLTKVPMEVLKSWVDTTAGNENIWLVLVFHGIDDLGWEPRTTADLETYYQYIKTKEKDLWVETFGKVTKYMRERMDAKVSNSMNGENIIINLLHGLDAKLYDEDLTLRTNVSNVWKSVQVKQNGKTQEVPVKQGKNGHFILYQATPNAGKIEISKRE